MPAQNETEVITFDGWTLRVRPATSQPARLLLLIHGLKGDENSMWVFARDLRPDYWIVAPRAPHAVNDGGYSWRVLQSNISDRPTLEMLKPALEDLLRVVVAYAASVHVDAAQFDLMGFSQGATMINLIALLHPERVSKAAILSGFMPEGVENLIAGKPLVGKQLFVAHGTQDETIPIQEARHSIELLEKAGAQVTYCEEHVGHKVSAVCLRSLKEYLGD